MVTMEEDAPSSGLEASSVLCDDTILMSGRPGRTLRLLHCNTTVSKFKKQKKKKKLNQILFSFWAYLLVSNKTCTSPVILNDLLNFYS
jgi:hypothetical protein